MEGLGQSVGGAGLDGMLPYHIPNNFFIDPLKLIYSTNIYLSFLVTQQPKSGLGRLLLETYRSHAVRHTTLGSPLLDE
jgi:hypothetical protein